MGKRQNAEETYMVSQYRLSGRHAQRSYQLVNWIDLSFNSVCTRNSATRGVS